MIDILQDVEILTTIPKSALNKIQDRIGDAIIHAICECESSNLSVDIGIGIFDIDLSDGKANFIFKPSDELTEKCNQALNNKEDALISSIEQRVIYKVLNTYKNLM